MSEPTTLILGANSDMAVALARRLAAAGATLHLASRDAEALEAEAANLRVRWQAEVQVHAFDALDTDTHPAFWAGLEPRPERVVLAFGLLGDQQVSQADFAQARAVLDTNFTGAVSVLELAAAELEAAGRGAIVGISSVAGDRGRQSNYIYGSAKAGFSAYLAGLRHRLFRSGVHVMTVKPGFVATKMTAGLDLPARLTATPDEVAAAIQRGLRRRRAVIYVKPIWRWIMGLIVHLPEQVFLRTGL